MPPPNNPNVARITYQYLRDTRQFNNTFHVYRGLGWTEAQLQNALTSAFNLWVSALKSVVPNSVTLFNIHGHVYDPLGSPWVADHPVSPADPGTRGGPAEAGNATLAISERADLAGRAYRGRIYIPGLVENDVGQNDQITAGLIAGLTSFALNWLSAYADPNGVGQLVIFHRNDNLFSTVRSIVLESIVDSQRRRLPGRGK